MKKEGCKGQWMQDSPYDYYEYCMMSSPLEADTLLVSGRWGIK